MLLSFTFVFRLISFPKRERRLSRTRKGEAHNCYPCLLILLVCFSSSVSQLCCLYVCSISTQKLQITRTPPQRTTETESHSTLAYTTLCTFTPLLFCLCFVLLCFPSKVCVSSVQDPHHPPEHVSQNRTCRSLGRTGNVAKCYNRQHPP